MCECGGKDEGIEVKWTMKNGEREGELERTRAKEREKGGEIE